MSNRLQGKDFISIGIYTAIYFVVNFIVSLLGFIPIFIPLTAVLVPLIGGIPMMLYFTKIKKFGMLTITGLLIGVLMLLTGMGYWCIITCVVFALITEFILKGSGYKSAKMEILAHGVFSIWTIGAFIPIIFFRDSYYANLVELGRADYADALMRFMPDWILPILIVGAFVAGIVGGIIGRKIFKKHFERAEIM